MSCTWQICIWSSLNRRNAGWDKNQKLTTYLILIHGRQRHVPHEDTGLDLTMLAGTSLVKWLYEMSSVTGQWRSHITNEASMYLVPAFTLSSGIATELRSLTRNSSTFFLVWISLSLSELSHIPTLTSFLQPPHLKTTSACVWAFFGSRWHNTEKITIGSF